MEKILIISQYFYPEDFRINDIAVELVSRGYQVKVITGIPNYPEGKFYPGYNLKDNRNEIYNNIEIIRLPIIARGKNKIQLALNYLSFILSGYLKSKTIQLKPDIIFTYEVSPMTQALIGPWIGKRLNIPTVLYVLDLWPENLEVIGGIRNKFIINLIRKMTDKIYKNTDLILTSSPSFVNEIQSYPIKQEKVKFWPQYGEDIYYPIEKDKENYQWVPNDNVFNIGFTGNIGDAQGLQILPVVAKILQEKNEYVRFVIVGDGRAKKELKQSIKQKEVESYFYFIERQPSTKISSILAEVDVAFLSFDPNPIFEKTIPAKLQTYMACGKPLLVSAGGEVKRIVEESQSGLYSPVGNTRILAETIVQFKNLDQTELQKMSNNSYAYFKTHFDKEFLMDKFEKLLNKLTNKD